MIQYLKDVRAEIRHVSWPTREQVVIYTGVVVVVSLGVAAYLGIFDYIFSAFVRAII